MLLLLLLLRFMHLVAFKKKKNQVHLDFSTQWYPIYTSLDFMTFCRGLEKLS